MNDFFRFSKKLGFWVFLVHPTAVSVLLSASVERCFVSLMRDFFLNDCDFKSLHFIDDIRIDIQRLDNSLAVDPYLCRAPLWCSLKKKKHNYCSLQLQIH